MREEYSSIYWVFAIIQVANKTKVVIWECWRKGSERREVKGEGNKGKWMEKGNKSWENGQDQKVTFIVIKWTPNGVKCQKYKDLREMTKLKMDWVWSEMTKLIKDGPICKFDKGILKGRFQNQCQNWPRKKLKTRTELTKIDPLFLLYKQRGLEHKVAILLKKLWQYPFSKWSKLINFC